MPATSRGGRQRIPRPETFRVTGPAPWAHLSAAQRHLTLDLVHERAGRFAAPLPEPIRVAGSRDAAVLIPLFERDDDVHVVLTKRPETMPSHQGEIAFPGGTVQIGLDRSPVDTALREAHEEIGLDPSLVEVVVALDRLGTVGSRFVIDPFVGLLAEPPELRADPARGRAGLRRATLRAARRRDLPRGALDVPGVGRATVHRAGCRVLRARR